MTRRNTSTIPRPVETDLRLVKHATAEVEATRAFQRFAVIIALRKGHVCHFRGAIFAISARLTVPFVRGCAVRYIK